jgi:hypothetical protein
MIQHATSDLVHVADDRILLHQVTFTTSGCLPVLQVFEPLQMTVANEWVVSKIESGRF